MGYAQTLYPEYRKTIKGIYMPGRRHADGTAAGGSSVRVCRVLHRGSPATTAGLASSARVAAMQPRAKEPRSKAHLTAASTPSTVWACEASAAVYRLTLLTSLAVGRP